MASRSDHTERSPETTFWIGNTLVRSIDMSSAFDLTASSSLVIASGAVGLDEPSQREPEDDKRRRAALIGFLGVGMHSAPSTAEVVSALADARRTVSALRMRGEEPDSWLASQARLRGLRENAGNGAVMELPEFRVRVAQAYIERYPDRECVLRRLLEYL
jgi:hypothetical protein